MSDLPTSLTMDVRPRYVECDPMGFVHHSVYPVWFEMARTELLRRTGRSYAELEREGLLMVVVRLNLSFHRPAKYDEALAITTTLRRAAGAKIEHDYEVARGGERLVSGSTVLACINREGRPQRVPAFLRYEP